MSHPPLPPSLQAEYSNKRHRPIGIGVQGLADAFILLRFPFDSPEARELNKKIFETIYFAALTASCELAQEEGPYDTYHGSPVSKGVSLFHLRLVPGDYYYFLAGQILQYDMWNVTPSDLWDWGKLKADIAR